VASVKKGERRHMDTTIPEVYGVAKARAELTRVLDGVERGQSYIIKGAKGRGEALVVNAEMYRQLQAAYQQAMEELETLHVLADESAMEAIRASEADDSYESVPLSTLADRVGIGELNDGERDF
jgi:PHD/YefM family antitoxin component YafN of YafNO toxin-antitoxin module